MSLLRLYRWVANLDFYHSDGELKIVGEYGLRNKREVWRVQLTLSKIRRAAR